MSVNLDKLILGEAYDRPYLANLWGFEDWHAISRGIVTPSNENKVIFFITKEKQHSLTQYEDYFDGELLHIDGENNHVNDDRIINSTHSGDLLYLFFREKHHSSFTYYGQIYLDDVERSSGDKPSKFVFKTSKNEAIATSSLLTEEITHGQVEEDFIPDTEGKKRIIKHIAYERSPKNRAKAIEIHGTRCIVCGFDFNKSFGKELARDYIEIHHIKSITEKEGPINPETDLVPLCSNCHSMVHRNREIIIPIEELKELIQRQVA